MTFFYDLNKRMADLANKQTLAEGKGSKPDFLDLDRDGNKKESMKKAAADKGGVEESALQAFIGKKKYGETGMKALQQAGRDGVSKEKMSKIRAQHNKMDEADVEEGNEFSGALVKARAQGAKEFDVDGKTYKVTAEAKKDKPKNVFDPEVARKMFEPEKGTGKFDKKVTATGTQYTRRYEEEPDDDNDAPENRGGQAKKKGRKTVGAGKGTKIGAKVKGTSKLSSQDAIAEDDSIALVDKGEYDREGDMAKEQLTTIELAAKELASILGDDENLPEWVQSKIIKAMDYVDTARDYMIATKADRRDNMMAEKAVSKAQAVSARIARAVQKGEAQSEPGTASAEMAKMPAKELKKFAKTDTKGLPKKVKEADAAPKAKGGIEFGKGVYESLSSKLENIISEGMNITVNISADEHGEMTKNITVSAEGHEAEALAQLLNLAGMKSDAHMEESYGDTAPSENTPDYPTETEIVGADDALLRRFSGGLNKQKSTGQTTVPVIASQATRQVSEQNQADTLGMNLYAELQSYKAK